MLGNRIVRDAGTCRDFDNEQINSCERDAEAAEGLRYIVGRAQAKHDLAVDIPTLQSPVQMVVGGAEYSCEDVRGGEYLILTSTHRVYIAQEGRKS